MADKPVDEVVQVDAALDALVSPTSSDVYEALGPYSNDAVAAVAAKRAAAGGGGGGSTPGALFVIEQSVAYTDVADVGNGNFMGPPITVPAGARLYGFGTVVETDFDDSGLSGADTSIGCGDITGGTNFNIALLNLKSANSSWTGSSGAAGFFGKTQLQTLQYKQTSGTSPNIVSLPMVTPPNQPELFPVEFTTAGNLRLLAGVGWQGDGSQGLVRISYYVCAAPATSFA